MNINYLEYFVLAVEHRSFADAAKSLFVSSQTVARAIAAIEKELQLELFNRSCNGVAPTPCALNLVPKAIEIVQAWGDLRSRASVLAHGNMGDIGISGPLNVAVTSSPYEGGVVPKKLFSEFSNCYSMIDLILSFNLSGVCISALFDGIVDAAVILGRLDRHRPDGVVCEKLFDTNLRVAVSRSHPLSTKDSVSLRVLGGYPVAKPSDLRFTYPILKRRFIDVGVRPKFVEMNPTVDDYSTFIHGKDGVVFVTHDSHLENLYSDAMFLSLSIGESVKMPVCLIYKQSNNEQIVSALQRFLINNMKAF